MKVAGIIDESDELCICLFCQATGIGQVKALSCAFYLSGTSRITHTLLASRRRAWHFFYVLWNSKEKVSKKLKDCKTKRRVTAYVRFFDTNHMVTTSLQCSLFWMLATVLLFWKDLLEQATARLQSPESGEARMFFGSRRFNWLVWQDLKDSTGQTTLGRNKMEWNPSYIFLPTYPSTYPSIYPSTYLAVCLSVRLSSYILSVNVLPFVLWSSSNIYLDVCTYVY